jgi:uncharacterized protein (DUF1015 family)
MLRVRAFRGLCPRPDLAPQIACVPYDVVNRDEAAALAADNPHSLLHVDRAEIDLPPEVHPYDDAVYARAQQNFERMQREGWLRRAETACLYLYRQQMGSHVQTGLAGVCHIDDYANDRIRKHEKTRKDKEDDRTRLIAALSANTGPVFLTYREDAVIDGLAARETERSPEADFTAPDGIRHTLWRTQDPEAFEQAFSRLPVAYVADGHHRSASAARVGIERRAANPAHHGNEDYNWFLCVLFPANQLQILPYNRVVCDLNGHTPETFLEALGKTVRLSRAAAPSPATAGTASMYLGGQWHSLTWDTDAGADPVARLDVSVLQDRVLAPLLGVEDPRTDKRMDFVGGIRGTSELERLVDGGEAALAFSMYPVTVEQLMDIADAGQIMPPKSTWFEPKLRSGLFVHTF